MFSELPKIFDRNFAVGYILPSSIFLVMNLGLAIEFELLPDLLNWLHSNPLIGITIIGFISLVGGVILMAANLNIIRIMEGYGRLNPLRLLLGIERRRYKKLHAEISTLDHEYKTCISTSKEFPTNSRLMRNQLMRKASERFPDQETLLLPTAFGNSIRAFEVYPRIMYGFESIQGWNRLLAVIPSNYLDFINSAKAQMDFWVNLGVISIMFVFEYFCLVLYTSQVNALWLTFIAIVISIIASIIATQCIRKWGELVKASFDIYLPMLHEELGFSIPKNKDEEREQWICFSQAIIYKLPKSMPNRSEKSDEQ